MSQNITNNSGVVTKGYLNNNEAYLVRFADVASGVAPTFPFTVTQLTVGLTSVFNAVTVPSTVVNNMAELVTLWNSNINELKIAEVNSTTFKLLPGTINLPYLPSDFISINDGFTTQRVWRTSRFIPTVKDEANASGVDKLVEQLRRDYRLEQFRNWDYLRSAQRIISYYPSSTAGTDPNNPSGNAGNVSTIEYRFGFITHLTQTYTYDASDNLLTVTTT